MTLFPAAVRQRWTAWRTGGRATVLRMVAADCPAHGLGLAGCVLLGAVVPVVLVGAMGRLVGEVAQRAPLVPTFVATGVLLVVSLTTSTFQDWLGSAISVRLAGAVRERLMRAVAVPVGVAHLTDRQVLDRLAVAEGVLSDFKPADAPQVLGRVYAARLGGLVACAALAVVSWWLGLVLLAVWLAVRVPLRRAITSHVTAFGGEAPVMRRARYFQQLATDTGAARELRLFGLGGWVVGQFRGHWLRGMATVWRIRGRLGRTIGWIAAVVLVAYGASGAWLGWSAYHGAIGLTTIATVLPLMLMTSAVGGISFDDISVEWMVGGLPQLLRLETELTRRAVALPGGGTTGDRPQERITFEGVTFRYPGADRDVVCGLDLTIEAGASTAVVGVNGAGKSTLVRLLARLYDPTGGRLLVDGVPLAELDAARWQRGIALIAQDFVRYPATFADNIGFGAVSALADRAGQRAALAEAGGLDVLDGLPEGWDTLLAPGLPGSTDLSGGQWQRVALARALFAARNGARVLVLDEPTALLDARGEAEFYERFLDVTRGLTTIVISHRFSTVRRANRICVLDAGQVLESGTHDELVAAGGEYSRMFQFQAARFARTGAQR